MYRCRASRDALEALKVSSRGLLSIPILENRVSTARTSLERKDLSRVYRSSGSRRPRVPVIPVLRDRRVSERHRDALTKSRAENTRGRARRREEKREREKERKRQLVAPGEEKERASQLNANRINTVGLQQCRIACKLGYHLYPAS